MGLNTYGSPMASVGADSTCSIGGVGEADAPDPRVEEPAKMVSLDPCGGSQQGLHPSYYRGR
jgi:hypothetical protein